MNLTQTEQTIQSAQTRIDALLALQIDNETFQLSNDDARRHLTSISGTAFDLKQLANALESERKALQEQLTQVEEAKAAAESAFTDASLVTQRLLNNKPLP